jgi:hypothetical protein
VQGENTGKIDVDRGGERKSIYRRIPTKTVMPAPQLKPVLTRPLHGSARRAFPEAFLNDCPGVLADVFNGDLNDAHESSFV